MEKSIEVSVPGTWVALDQYKKDMGSDPEANGHRCQKVDDPLTGKEIDAVFVPEKKPGYFSGKITAAKRVKLSETVDDDIRALRTNQVEESFQNQQSSFNANMVPALSSSSATMSDMDAIVQKRLQLQDEARMDGVLDGLWDFCVVSLVVFLFSWFQWHSIHVLYCQTITDRRRMMRKVQARMQVSLVWARPMGKLMRLMMKMLLRLPLPCRRGKTCSMQMLTGWMKIPWEACPLIMASRNHQWLLQRPQFQRSWLLRKQHLSLCIGHQALRRPSRNVLRHHLVLLLHFQSRSHGREQPRPGAKAQLQKPVKQRTPKKRLPMWSQRRMKIWMTLAFHLITSPGVSRVWASWEMMVASFLQSLRRNAHSQIDGPMGWKSSSLSACSWKSCWTVIRSRTRKSRALSLHWRDSIPSWRKAGGVKTWWKWQRIWPAFWKNWKTSVQSFFPANPQLIQRVCATRWKACPNFGRISTRMCPTLPFQVCGYKAGLVLWFCLLFVAILLLLLLNFSVA